MLPESSIRKTVSKVARKLYGSSAPVAIFMVGALGALLLLAVVGSGADDDGGDVDGAADV